MEVQFTKIIKQLKILNDVKNKLNEKMNSMLKNKILE